MRACVLETTPLAEDAGSVDSEGTKVTRPEVVLEVLRYRRRFLEVDRSNVEKADKVECIYRLEP